MLLPVSIECHALLYFPLCVSEERFILQGRMILSHLCDEPKGLKTSMCMVRVIFWLIDYCRIMLQLNLVFGPKDNLNI